MELKKIFLANGEETPSAIHQENDFVDVIVYLKNGGKYIGSFLSYDAIGKLKRSHEMQNEFLSGKYFFLNNMILIDDCSEKNITQVVHHLLDEGDFKSVFKQISAA